MLDFARSMLRSTLDAATWGASRRLAEPLRLAFQAGDDLQREWVDRLSDAFAAGALHRPLAAAAASSAELLRFASPGAEGEALRLELANKATIYRLVTGVEGRLGLPPDGALFPLAPYVERAYAEHHSQAMWLLEGLGHRYTAAQLRREPNIAGTLAAEPLPPASQFMLHAGLGMALTEHVLAGLSPQAPAPRHRQAVERFVGLCRANAVDGYGEAALESFGLVARCFFSSLVPALGRAVAELGEPRLAGYFWHGVGRGLYFVPVSFLPGYGSTWRAIEMARREAPPGEAVGDAVAGVAYAATLVNLGHPLLLESLLRHRGTELAATTFSQGVTAAVLMHRHALPDDRGREAFLRHRPADRRTAEAWQRLVSEPCHRALSGSGRGGVVYDAAVRGAARTARTGGDGEPVGETGTPGDDLTRRSTATTGQTSGSGDRRGAGHA